VGCFLEVLTIFIHQGVYKYYIVNILPLLTILGALPLYAIILRISRHEKIGIKNVRKRISYCVVSIYLIGCLVGIVCRLDINLKNSTTNQRLHIKYLHSLFPETIPYADGVGLLSKYNNVLRFFSNKKFNQYLRNGKAKFEQYFSRIFPVLIIESERFDFLFFVV
jgi:hypothetical protein